MKLNNCLKAESFLENNEAIIIISVKQCFGNEDKKNMQSSLLQNFEYLNSLEVNFYLKRDNNKLSS